MPDPASYGSREYWLQHYRRYNANDQTRYRLDSHGQQFEWAMPDKYYQEILNGTRDRPPKGMPYPVPLDTPHCINTFGWEPRSDGRLGYKTIQYYQDVPSEQVRDLCWRGHECRVLWVMYKMLTVKFGASFPVWAYEKYQVYSYLQRTHPLQALSKLVRLGCMTEDWRFCDFYISRALSQSIGKDGYLVSRKYLACPSGTSTTQGDELMEYVLKHSAVDTAPDRNLRLALRYIYAAADTIQPSPKQPNTRPKLVRFSSTPSELCDEEQSEVTKQPIKFRAADLQRISADRCALHCHGSGKREACKKRSLSKYPGRKLLTYYTDDVVAGP